MSNTCNLSFAVSGQVLIRPEHGLNRTVSHMERKFSNSLRRNRSSLRYTTPLRRPRTWRCESRAELPASTASIYHEGTGTTIHLIGCVHGSKVSASDVRSVVKKTTPDAIILELCESRLSALQTSISTNSSGKTSTRDLYQKGTRPPFGSIVNMYGGVGPALMAIVLEAVYRMQAFVGIDPGVEFLEVMKNCPASKIVCGDAPAKDTVQKLFGVFATPLKSLRLSRTAMKDLIQRLIILPKSGVNTAALMFSQPARVMELLQLLLPATVVSVALGIFGTTMASAVESSPAITNFASTAWGGFLAILLNFSQIAISTYLIISGLHFMKVLIVDRDRILLDSILETATRENKKGNSAPTICAVVGLLHVNGIVRMLGEQTG